MTYVKLEDAVKALEELRHCLRGLDGDWPDALYEAIEALRSLPTDDGWEDIATCPDRVEVLAWVENLGVVHVMKCSSVSETVWYIENDCDGSQLKIKQVPTHWRPLPAPPAC